MYCTAPLSPRKGRLISFHDDDDDDDDYISKQIIQRLNVAHDYKAYVEVLIEKPWYRPQTNSAVS